MTEATDDFDALFDAVSAQRDEAAVQLSTAQAPSPAIVEAGDRKEAVTKGIKPEPLASPDLSEMPLFDRLGGIVRMLHDSLHELGYDKGITDASAQINDAQDRLEFVEILTEQAATKVLNTLEEAMPKQDELCKRAKDMDARWVALFAGNLTVDEFKVLARDSRNFARMVANSAEAEKARLLDIMMAQGFQDITGQLIKKVVAITKKIEQELAQLLRDNAPLEVKEKLASAVEYGPSLPGDSMAQDSVDELLADLGF